MPATIFRWDAVEEDHPIPLIDRRRVFSERMSVAQVVLHPGFRVPSHHHPEEQISIVLSGRVRWSLGEEGSDAWEERITGAGEVVVLPPNFPHGVVAEEESHLFDLYSPPAFVMGVDAVAKK